MTDLVPLLETDLFGGIGCDKEMEHCYSCGALMEKTARLTGEYDRETGRPLYRVFHVCPTYLKEKPWWKRLLMSIDGVSHHAGHDAINPLIPFHWYR